MMFAKHFKFAKRSNVTNLSNLKNKINTSNISSILLYNYYIFLRKVQIDIEHKVLSFVTYRTSGEKLLLAIVNHARKKKLDRFDVKVICALHLLERYLAIEALVPDISRGSEIRESIMNKFRNREHAYLPIERVNLYSICESLGHR